MRLSLRACCRARSSRIFLVLNLKAGAEAPQADPHASQGVDGLGLWTWGGTQD